MSLPVSLGVLRMESTADMAGDWVMTLSECCVVGRGFNCVNKAFCGVGVFRSGDPTVGEFSIRRTVCIGIAAAIETTREAVYFCISIRYREESISTKPFLPASDVKRLPSTADFPSSPRNHGHTRSCPCRWTGNCGEEVRVIQQALKQPARASMGSCHPSKTSDRCQLLSGPPLFLIFYTSF